MHETEKQRSERNFGDLLQELRVTQAGVQILFAFLLALPFTSRFDELTGGQRLAHLVALLSSACAAATIISPVALHRVLFRRGRKPEMVRFAHRASCTGMACSLVSILASVLMITDFLLPRPTALILTAATAVWFLLLWAVLPLLRRGIGRRELSAEQLARRFDAGSASSRRSAAG